MRGVSSQSLEFELGFAALMQEKKGTVCCMTEGQVQARSWVMVRG